MIDYLGPPVSDLLHKGWDPDPPSLGILDRLGVPRVTEGLRRTAADADLPDRRALLARFVATDGWSWST